MNDLFLFKKKSSNTKLELVLLELLKVIEKKFNNFCLNPNLPINETDIKTAQKVLNSSSDCPVYLRSLMKTAKGTKECFILVLNHHLKFDFKISNNGFVIYLNDLSGTNEALKQKNLIQELIQNNLAMWQTYGGIKEEVPPITINLYIAAATGEINHDR